MADNLCEGLWLAPGGVEMPAVMAPMTGVTVGATKSFAVAPKTSGLGGKPVLPVFGRSDDEKKRKHHHKKRHHSEWLFRGELRLVEVKEPHGLEGQNRRSTDEDPAEIKIRAWHEKHKLPWPGAKLSQPKGRVIDLRTTPMDSAHKIMRLQGRRVKI